MARKKKTEGAGRKYVGGSSRAADIDPIVDALEGALQEIRDQRPTEDNDYQDTRPKAMPPILIAALLGVSAPTFKKWLSFHRSRRSESEGSDRFCETYALICHEVAARVASTTFTIACDPTNSQAFRAGKYLLEKIDPHVFGDAADEVEKEEQLADIPSEVFDALTDAEKSEIEEHGDAQDKRAALVDDILARARARVREREDQDDPEDFD